MSSLLTGPLHFWITLRQICHCQMGSTLFLWNLLFSELFTILCSFITITFIYINLYLYILLFLFYHCSFRTLRIEPMAWSSAILWHSSLVCLFPDFSVLLFYQVDIFKSVNFCCGTIYIPNFKVFKIILEMLFKKTINENLSVHPETFLRPFISLKKKNR